MKKSNILFVALVLVALGISCTDTSKYPVPFDQINNSNAGILKIISQGSVILTSDIPGSKYEVTFEANDRERGRLFTNVELYVSYNDLTNNGLGSDKPEALLHTYANAEFVNDPVTGLPRITMTHTATEVMTLLGVTLPEIVNGKDQFIFRQAMVFPDGKTYSSNNVSTPIASTGGVYKSPFENLVTIYVCASELDGDVDYVNVVGGAVVPITACLPSVSGTSTLSKISHGVYGLADATFGQYDCAWSDNPAAGVNWEDFCDDITVTGSDQYGLLYSYSIVSNDGTTLVLDWSNDYGDYGQVSLVRSDGSSWPLTLNFL